MRGLILLLALLCACQLLAQPVSDSVATLSEQPEQQLETSKEEIKVDIQKLLRQWADSVQQNSNLEEALLGIETLREELNTSIVALGDSLEQENPVIEEKDLVSQFKGSFQEIWEGLSKTLTIGNLWAMVFIFIVGFSINALLKRWKGEKETMPHKKRLRRMRWYPLLRFINWTAVTFLVAALLLQDPDVLWPALTALAIGLGLAIKDGLVDLLGGLWLIFDHPYQIGDRIQAAGHYGEVTRIGIRSTQITTLDDNLVTIPNSIILNDPVSNSNVGQTHCMAVVKIWLPSNADLKLARSMAYEAAITSRYFNFDEGVKILFNDHLGDPPGTILKVKAYVLDAKFEKAFEGDVTETVKRAFIKADMY